MILGRLIFKAGRYMKKIKRLFKKLWYFISKKEYRLGWKMTGPNVVILNDNHICKITIDKRK